MDRYQSFARSGIGRFVVGKLGLPDPHPLRRHSPGRPPLDGPVLLGGRGRLVEPVRATLGSIGLDVTTDPTERTDTAGRTDTTQRTEAAERPAALVFDATGIEKVEDLRDLHTFFHPSIRSLGPCGRVVVLGTPPASAVSRIAQRALEGFTRSVGKELKRGGTAQLVYVAEGAEGNVESTLRFLLSGRSAYVSGQVIRIGAGPVEAPDDWDAPLAGKVALVTGASRGIGAAIAEVLARDGAHVVCLDVPGQGEELSAVANRVKGSTIQLDITAPDAPARIVEHVDQRHGGVDVVVHNAGITRDRTLGRMDEGRWDAVLQVNLACQERVNQALFDSGALRPNGRVVGVSSIAGIAGNVGQTNYATTKAGVIGLVDALSEQVDGTGTTVNAVAPGFIETRMTAAVPLVIREAGRRMNSLSQGGLPVDVAETVAWFAHPASAGVNGNVVRVCGQSLLGA
ncbi:3-oxoacyl-ACP reductase [Actinosynnema sp. NPDC047251]|uniref:3-ketoacyl-(Acyl-carrier-protein) reductase n=1 Tax=Saccharothrix espanaensis (strain ATCC 51144 / DSM 44229 / JCM 9112 / NBRC 15066 / NRRL 15764) TaxID=1179773 RepID=K0KGG2_SACES|nr:3-oxoacyl-ACP reductase [Saccharothrix espanaensis]CCH35588.1 3-ketoacyl-(acyl-carrier-protein) reductase [Saccharothrix espanaensis DSM 44229]